MKFPVHRISTEPGVATATKAIKELWPFVAGFGFTGFLMVKIAAGVTDEDVKASKFANPKGNH